MFPAFIFIHLLAGVNIVIVFAKYRKESRVFIISYS